jgi:lipopolysaccharide transport system ATP-binding protein
MGDIAIRVDKLSKRYRIGRSADGASGQGTVLRAVVAPFRYLISTLREPAPEETIWALKDVSFEVKRGQVTGIIGRNGAGKSTLLKILSRITEPTAGRAIIHGRVGSLLEVGTGFHPELTGRENVYLSGAILGMKRAEIERKFEEIVAFAEVGKFIDTPVKHYSSGMSVRLAFAVAAHLEPEVLLVDEVLAVGDAAFQRKCLGRMGSVVKEGRTVLFVSHNMGAISNLTQDCIWIEGGRIAAEGEADRVVSEYMLQMDSLTPSRGWADLSGLKRNPYLTGRKAQLCWVRTLDAKGRQGGAFLEGEPITIELGFQVMERIRSAQFGCSVEAVRGNVELFTVPSPEFDEVLEPGSYSVQVHVNPNYLREGDYTLAAKMFAEGARQDTIDHIIRLTIQPYLSSDDDPVYLHKWVAGHLRLDYEWGSIEGKPIPDVESSAS